MPTGFTSVVIGLVLAVLIVIIGNFGFHIPEGGGRLVLFGIAALVFALFAFGPGRIWSRRV